MKNKKIKLLSFSLCIIICCLLLNFIAVEYKNMLEDRNKEISSILELDSDLCDVDEEAIYSFKIADSERTLSVIVSKSNGYMICRLGTKDSIEVEFPQGRENSWEQFTYGSYYRGGGEGNLGMELNHLYFETEEYSYDVYYDYRVIDRNLEAGIKIVDKNSGVEEDLKADTNSILGSLRRLSEESRINAKQL